MTRFPVLVALVCATLATACTFDDDATKFRVTVENVSRDHLLPTERLDGAVPLSPGAFAVFKDADDDLMPIFVEGDGASHGLERLAEDGIPSKALGGDDLEQPTLADELAGAPFVLDWGTFASPADLDEGSWIMPGESASFTLFARPGDRLQLVTMFGQ